MPTPRAELVRWVRRFAAVQERIDAEHRAHPLKPEASLDQALELALLVEETCPQPRGAAPSDEDLAAWAAWARLRRGGVD